MRHTFGCALALFVSSMACANPSTEQLVTLKAEYTVPVSEVAGLLPDAIEEAATLGDIEIRQQIQYDAPERQLIVWTFVASPLWQRPASLVDVQNNQLDQFRVDISAVNITQSSWRTTVFEGTVHLPATTALMVAGGMSTSLMNAAPGKPVRFAVSDLPDDAERRLSNLSLTVLGGTRWTAASAVGSVKLEPAPNRAPIPSVITPPAQSASFEIAFDASASTDPDGDALDYKWHVLGGTVALRGCETPTPVFQFNQGPGTYDFRLTLTDSRGATTITTYRVQYTGR